MACIVSSDTNMFSHSHYELTMFLTFDRWIVCVKCFSVTLFFLYMPFQHWRYHISISLHSEYVRRFVVAQLINTNWCWHLLIIECALWWNNHHVISWMKHWLLWNNPCNVNNFIYVGDVEFERCFYSLNLLFLFLKWWIVMNLNM